MSQCRDSSSPAAGWETPCGLDVCDEEDCTCWEEHMEWCQDARCLQIAEVSP